MFVRCERFVFGGRNERTFSSKVMNDLLELAGLPATAWPGDNVISYWKQIVDAVSNKTGIVLKPGLTDSGCPVLEDLNLAIDALGDDE